MWTAVACAVSVGVCTWLAEGSSSGVRLLAALIGLVVGLLIMLLVAWALSAEEAAVPERPAAYPPVEPEPVVAPAAPAPPADLAARLEEGRALAADGAPPESVESWIGATREDLERHRPGVLGYFAALGARTYPDAQSRLDAHLRRLETIVRDLG